VLRISYQLQYQHFQFSARSLMKTRAVLLPKFRR
jgi:hypothetical protein